MIKEDIDAPGEKVAALVRQIFVCNRLTQLEGVGSISSVLLYATSGTGEAFVNIGLFSAYLGVTP